MLFVFSAPSGAGKTTIIRELFKKFPNLKFSVSATTRNKRENEVDGTHYHFISIDEFNKRKENNEFAECEEVHGNFYGTLKSEIEPYINSHTHIVFDVDVKGALNIKNLYPAAVTIFVDVPFTELERRLKGRNTESPEDIEKRLSRIKLEAGMKDKFDFIVDNGEGIDKAVKEAEGIINKVSTQQK